jgi:hypothetical protein
MFTFSFLALDVVDVRSSAIATSPAEKKAPHHAALFNTNHSSISFVLSTLPVQNTWSIDQQCLHEESSDIWERIGRRCCLLVRPLCNNSTSPTVKAYCTKRMYNCLPPGDTNGVVFEARSSRREHRALQEPELLGSSRKQPMRRRTHQRNLFPTLLIQDN